MSKHAKPERWEECNCKMPPEDHYREVLVELATAVVQLRYCCNQTWCPHLVKALDLAADALTEDEYEEAMPAICPE
jgi:hypothetical protein